MHEGLLGSAGGNITAFPAAASTVAGGFCEYTWVLVLRQTAGATDAPLDRLAWLQQVASDTAVPPKGSWVEKRGNGRFVCRANHNAQNCRAPFAKFRGLSLDAFFSASSHLLAFHMRHRPRCLAYDAMPEEKTSSGSELVVGFQCAPALSSDHLSHFDCRWPVALTDPAPRYLPFPRDSAAVCSSISPRRPWPALRR